MHFNLGHRKDRQMHAHTKQHAPPRVTDIMPRCPEKKAVSKRVPTVRKPITAIAIIILVNHGRWNGFSCWYNESV